MYMSVGMSRNRSFSVCRVPSLTVLQSQTGLHRLITRPKPPLDRPFRTTPPLIFNPDSVRSSYSLCMICQGDQCSSKSASFYLHRKPIPASPVERQAADLTIIPTSLILEGTVRADPRTTRGSHCWSRLTRCWCWTVDTHRIESC